MSTVRRFFRSARRGSLRSDLSGRLKSWRHDHRRLAVNAERAHGTDSSARINQLAQWLPVATSYLEIGVEHGYTLEAVAVPNKVGVDPDPRFSRHALPAGLVIFPITSDQYFENLDDDATFDIIFLDGLHTYQQTYRDLINALNHLAAHGAVIIDDVVPLNEISAMPDLAASINEQVNRGVSDFRWHGDVFRIIPVLRDHHPELHFRTLVGGGNEQTLLWKTNSDRESIGVDEATLEAYGHVSYNETFAQGIPDFFMVGSFEEVLQEIQSRPIETTRVRSSETSVEEESP